MNKLSILFAVIIVGFILIYNSLDSGSSKTKIKEEPKQIKIIKKEKKEIEILYLENEKKEPEPQKKAKETIVKQNVKDNNEYEDLEQLQVAEIVKYIENNNLIDITPLKTNQKDELPQRFSIYADISAKEAKEQYDKSFPPPAPGIVSGKTSNGSFYTIVVDPYVNSKAETILVTSNDENGEITGADSVKTILREDEEPESIAPPSIGQQ